MDSYSRGSVFRGKQACRDISVIVFVALTFNCAARSDRSSPSNESPRTIQDTGVTQETTEDPRLEWIRTLQGSGESGGASVTSSRNGSVLFGGVFTETMTIDLQTETIQHNSNGGKDIYVSKLDRRGAVLWTRTFGGSGDDTLADIEVGEDGSVHLTGIFFDEVDFDPGDGATVARSNGERDIFVVKLDANGHFQWMRSFGGPGIDAGNALALGPEGSVVVTGHFQQTVDLDPGDGVEEHHSGGGWDVFVLKLDPSGGFVWARTFGGEGRLDFGQGVAVAPRGDVLAIGDFCSVVDFDPGPGTAEHTAAEEDVFVVKFNRSGVFEWVRTFGGPSVDRAFAIELTQESSLLVVGSRYDAPKLGRSENSYGFVSKLEIDGSTMWTKEFRGEGSVFASDLAILPDQSFLMTGNFSSSVDLDPGAANVMVTSEQENGAFAVSLGIEDGAYRWGWALDRAEFLERASVAAALDGSIYVTGIYQGTVDLAPGSAIDVRSTNGAPSSFLLSFSGQ